MQIGSAAQERRAQERARMRRRIQEKARDMFAEHGYERTKVEEIARSVGASVGMVYLHFLSKDDLLVSLLAEGVIDEEHELWPDVVCRLAARGLEKVADAVLEAAAKRLIQPALNERSSSLSLGETILDRAMIACGIALVE